MTQINVKLVEVYGGVLSGTSSSIIEIFQSKDSDVKYYSYTESCDRYENTHIYIYPDVNPIIYQMIDFIKKCGPTLIDKDTGNVCGPHLTRKLNNNKNGGYILYRITPNQEIALSATDIVPATTLIPDQDWFEQLVKL
jgi:hypothetical protein